jgi:hypothetical protein
MRVKAGVPVHFHSKEGRQTMGRIVDCQPMGSNPQGWRLGAQLDEPDNFWGLNPCPEDWAAMHAASGTAAQTVTVTDTPARRHRPTADPQAKSASQVFSEADLRKTVAQLLQPLQAEVVELRSKLSQRDANHSRFEVSLSQIPPQLEEQLWGRLRQDIGQRTLQLTREEAERVLNAAHAAIEHKITKTQQELQQEIAKELKAAERRTQLLGDGVAENVQRHFHAGLENLQQQVFDANARLESRSEELIRALEERLEEEHRGHRQEMQRVQEEVAAEGSRLQEHIDEVSGRLEKLDESARRLESELEARMTAIARDIVQQARTQLEGTVHVLLKQLSTRSAEQLTRQLDEGCGRLARVQGDVEASLSQSLQSKIAQSIESFQQTMQELAQQCVGRWRLALVKDLNSAAARLAQQLKIDSEGAES